MNKIEATLAAYPAPIRERLRALRELILETARETPGVGRIEEDLRWGQPSFLTPETKSGSTVRIGGVTKDSERYAIYFHCQSGLVEKFQAIYGDTFSYEGRRAITLSLSDRVPRTALKHCIALALTHHLRKSSCKTGHNKDKL